MGLLVGLCVEVDDVIVGVFQCLPRLRHWLHQTLACNPHERSVFLQFGVHPQEPSIVLYFLVLRLSIRTCFLVHFLGPLLHAFHVIFSDLIHHFLHDLSLQVAAIFDFACAHWAFIDSIVFVGIFQATGVSVHVQI